jgi:hypothetical protein
MESSKFSPTPLSKMKIDDKNSYYQQPTKVDPVREDLSTLFNSIGVGKILSSTVSLYNFLPW